MRHGEIAASVQEHAHVSDPVDADRVTRATLDVLREDEQSEEFGIMEFYEQGAARSLLSATEAGVRTSPEPGR